MEQGTDKLTFSQLVNKSRTFY